MAVKAQLKWKTNVYDIEVDSTSDTFESLQAKIYSLTSVPPDRQKLLSKGKFIKGDADIKGIAEGAKLMLTGSADEIQQAPTKAIIFEEDLTDKQRAELQQKRAIEMGDKDMSSVIIDSAGLDNLGNTCYMNAVVQNLRAIPELKEALTAYSQQRGSAGIGGDQTAGVTVQFGNLLKQLDSTTKPVTPLVFTTLFRSVFPQFAERSSEGGFQQQDADEALNTLLNTMGSALSKSTLNNNPVFNSSTHVGKPATNIDNVVDALFSGEYRVTMKNSESADEPPKVTYENFLKLRCHIDIKTTYLLDGLTHDMTSQLERRSDTLGRNAIYEQRHEIVRLPQNLIVQFLRFEWKQDVQKKAKKLKKVDFPIKLDVMPLCDPSLRASLSQARKINKSIEDIKHGFTPMNKPKSVQLSGLANIRSDEVELKEGEKPTETQMKEAERVDTTGFYELYGVVTHKGRYADAGHYIGWVRQPGATSNNWWKFDDQKVTQHTTDDIQRLNGGGDHDMAYLLMYRRVDDMKDKEWKIHTAEDVKAKQTTDTEMKEQPKV